PAAISTPCPAELVPGWSSQLLRLRAPLLRLEPPFARSRRRLRRDASTLHLQGLSQLLDEPLDRQLAVPQLAALVLGDRAKRRSGLGEDAAFLGIREGRGRLDVEDRLHPCLGRVRVLSARTARARETEL